jgi:hypothetical protein
MVKFRSIPHFKSWSFQKNIVAPIFWFISNAFPTIPISELFWGWKDAVATLFDRVDTGDSADFTCHLQFMTDSDLPKPFTRSATLNWHEQALLGTWWSLQVLNGRLHGIEPTESDWNIKRIMGTLEFEVCY